MIYFDTDILVHSLIIQDKSKHDVSVSQIAEAIFENKCYISTLAIQETGFVLAKLGFNRDFIRHNILNLLYFATHFFAVNTFVRASDLAYEIGFKNINDCIHTALAEEYCDELITYNKRDFQKIQKYTDLKITILS